MTVFVERREAAQGKTRNVEPRPCGQDRPAVGSEATAALLLAGGTGKSGRAGHPAAPDRRGAIGAVPGQSEPAAGVDPVAPAPGQPAAAIRPPQPPRVVAAVVVDVQQGAGQRLVDRRASGVAADEGLGRGEVEAGETLDHGHVAGTVGRPQVRAPALFAVVERRSVYREDRLAAFAVGVDDGARRRAAILDLQIMGMNAV
ncbi:MAG: hypothetical protein OXF88_19915 [Rhodobacteraceae bacterium]|nr:hypothetical protein [Paracoccaceae bacterium]